VISTAIEGVSGTGLEAQSSQTDAVKSLIRWESPHTLSIAGVIYNRCRREDRRETLGLGIGGSSWRYVAKNLYAK
jgi:hypothetical protein